ncbi:AraC family transcriptional regulator [Xanthocytophaga agilis]|uniref:Helix-turn-helix domain-containing protein n=1 Tax=Xanthocytophaga agilis TaxID=3048010 RepID=A0AAE3R337_9BACT|nr:helix-turn-helix domain-containing protein [Xanthocytophaga agilis]MDJ1499973.1 helix-turn-helix domain-containing protein [Xanthocytophaga agilis]
MLPKDISKEHKQRLETVINYILKNLNNDISLEVLAEKANYSPFHLQKLFKQAMGESPKQYIIRMRLETAAHYLIVYGQKSITEVAYECGFSSPAVFARAFKSYFGISAEKMRQVQHQQQVIIRKESFHLKGLIDSKKIVYAEGGSKKTLKVEIKKIAEMRGIFINAPLQDETLIQQSFKDILCFADAHDMLTSDTRMLGLIYPHQDRYGTCISISKEQAIPKNTETITISGGKYAVFKVRGGVRDTFRALQIFHDQWLPDSGYKIAELFGFEVFMSNPALVVYSRLVKEVYIPLEPV